MIRELHEADRQAILDLAYQRERENLFLIGNVESPTAFSENRFFGAFDEGHLCAVSAWFGRYGSFTATGREADIPHVVDSAVDAALHIESVPAIQPYARLIIERLRQRGLVPRVEHPSFLLELRKEEFHPLGSASRPAREEDRDALVLLQRSLRERDASIPLTEQERSRIMIEDTFVGEEGGLIVAKATAGARSRHYAQVVGVITRADYRRRGYGAGCMSALCERCFTEGKEAVLLCTEKKNLAAQALYAKLGFEIVGDFLAAEYA